MKSNYTTNRPLMKMSSPEMMSSRPPHETRKPETVLGTVVSMDRGPQGIKGFKK